MGYGVWPHVRAAMCRRDVDRSAVTGVLSPVMGGAERGAALPLRGLRREVHLAETGGLGGGDGRSRGGHPGRAASRLLGEAIGADRRRSPAWLQATPTGGTRIGSRRALSCALPAATPALAASET